MTNRWLTSTAMPMSRLRSEFDRMVSEMFNEFFGGRPVLDLRPGYWARTFPAVNLWEDDEHLYAEAEVPGLKMEDLEILVKGNELTIKGERKGLDREGVRYHRRERGTGAFSSVVQLPVEIDVNRVEASLENGVLMVKMPKAETARPRKIEVKALSS
jgi:HSP20 family protein